MLQLSSNEQFETLINNSENKPVLVDFHTDWCGPCKMMSPVVEAIAEQYANRLDVVKVDAGQFQDITAKYGVRGIPTLMLFKQGTPTSSKVGAVSLKQIEAFVDEQL
ncbi:MAG: hypothetical protein DHS20C12_18780 [Pseudohongiella sp.]|nr:MAG: hypothetical protein DHS20C12_18780 [Pseudohongiella sp.]